LIKPVKQYYESVDALRCIAVFSVLFSHFINQKITLHLFLGAAGVDLFFVISGFLITEILFGYKAKKRSLIANLKIFYIRRTIRIFPIYYLFLIVTFFLFRQQVSEAISWAFCYCINIYNETHSLPLIFDHLWSLSIEEQFYLCWPLIILLTPWNWELRVISSLILIGIIYRVSVNDSRYMLSAISCLDAFGIGALLAYLKRYKENLLLKILQMNWIWATIIVLWAIKIYLSFHEMDFLLKYFRLMIAILSFVLIGKAVYIGPLQNNNWWTMMMKNKWMIRLGRISYGIYMFHYLVFCYLKPIVDNAALQFLDKQPIRLISLLFFNRANGVDFILYSNVTILLASLSFKFLETPILKSKKYFK